MVVGDSRRPSAPGIEEKLAFRKSEYRKVGPLRISPMGMGTWAWGNQFLWGYDQRMDSELEAVFDLVVSRGINLFDTADSYGTGLPYRHLTLLGVMRLF
jgi:pyridoxine 4-dehydrogenase